MPTVVFQLADGTRREVHAAAGKSLMNAALSAAVEGIDADCGGTCSCATCHVYVDPAWAARLPAPAANELEMLDFVAAELAPTSRLSCQIVIDDGLEGLVVRLPEFQSP